MDELDDDDRSARRATRLVAASSMGALLVITGLMAHSSGAGSANASGTDAGATDGSTSSTAAASTTLAGTAADSTAVASPTTTAAPTTTTTCTSTYTVQSGDSWYLLAQEASVSADALFAANGASSSTALYPGQTVCLPDGAVVVTTVAPVTTATPATTATKSTTAATTPAPSHTTATSG